MLIIFQDEFNKSKGKPIKYMGKTLVMLDRFPLTGKVTKLKYRIISTNSEWRQGISLKTKGGFTFGGREEITESIGIWEDTAPREGEFVCRSQDKTIEVVNVWDTGNGVVESWYNGAAMWIEELPDGRRYHCNDGHFDDDFDDIVFEILYA